jgi:hypothetical protein
VDNASTRCPPSGAFAHMTTASHHQVQEEPKTKYPNTPCRWRGSEPWGGSDLLRRHRRIVGQIYFGVDTQTNDRQVGSPCVVRKEVASADRAEPSPGLIAAVCDADILAWSPLNLDRLSGEDGVGRAVASQVLTITAPTDPRNDGLAGQSVANGPAQAASGALWNGCPLV